MRLLSCPALALLAALSSPAAATTFSFIADDNVVVPTLWNYREIATRTVIGCRQWDVLQGTGWFQATWYTDYTPISQGHVYTVTPTQKLPAKICAAKMDAYNSVRVQVNTEAGLLQGSFAVVPDGLSPAASITCRPHPEGSAYDNLACEAAHVQVEKNGSVQIEMRFEP